ncbi:MAG: GDSL-type esterase/lipase family protein [Cellulosilyticaceae bacterium]
MSFYGKFEAKYGIVGRWFIKKVGNVEYLATINMGSQLYFGVTGAEQITLHCLVQEGPSAIVYQIDGGEPQRCLVSTEMVLAEGLDQERYYEVKIVVDDIPESNDLWQHHSGFLLEGVDVGEMGQVTPVTPIGKRILFVGDSITAGIAVRPDYRGQPYSGGASINYAAICSQKLGAVDLRCAFGYTGILNPGPIGIPPCSGYLEEICQGMKAPQLQPDVVVINHGTNDALHGQPVEAFEVAYQSLLEDVRVRYPQAKVLVLIPFGQYLADEIRRVVRADGLSQLIETADWGVIFGGDGVHVDVKGSQIAGEQLAKVIKNMAI